MDREDITREYLKYILKYNHRTGVFVWVKSSRPGWIGKKAGTVRYTHSGKHYSIIKINGFGYAAHRLAYLYVHGFMPKMIDHKNGKSLDNRISNLKQCTACENTQNHTKRLNRGGLPTGVRKTKNGRYQARIRAHYITYYLGVFDTLLEAKSAYDKKRKSIHYNPARK